MNEKVLIEIFAGMASLVCLVSGLHRDERRKIAIRVATIRRTKVGYQQIQRHNEMALSPPYAFTFAIDRWMDCESAAKLLTKAEARRIAANVAKRPEFLLASERPGFSPGSGYVARGGID